MKALVVGLGNIARRHIKNLKTINPNIEIAVYRQNSKKADLNELGPFIQDVFFKINEAVAWRPDITLITNPASLHVKTALIFIKKGSHLFIEKPLSVSTSGIANLLKESRRRKRVVMVGYNFRFLEPLKILKQALEYGKIGRILYIRAMVGQYLPDWRLTKDYRLTVSARRDLGGGVVFELSHELDYVRWLIGEIKTVNAATDKLSDLKINVEDIAEIILQFKNGAMGSIHLDMIDHATSRYCRVIGTEGTIIWDGNESNNVHFYCAKTKSWQVLYQSNTLDRNQMYIDELKHFFNCIEQKKEPLINIASAKRVVEIALAVKRSAKTGKVVKV